MSKIVYPYNTEHNLIDSLYEYVINKSYKRN